MVSKHISIWRTFWAVRIGCMDFQNKNIVSWSKSLFYFTTHHSPSLYIYVEIGYCALGSKEPLVLPARISIFKVQIVDPNRSTCSPYWNVLGDQILHFFEFFLLFIKPLWKPQIRWSRNFYCFLLFTVDLQFSKMLNK